MHSNSCSLQPFRRAFSDSSLLRLPQDDGGPQLKIQLTKSHSFSQHEHSARQQRQIDLYYYQHKFEISKNEQTTVYSGFDPVKKLVVNLKAYNFSKSDDFLRSQILQERKILQLVQNRCDDIIQLEAFFEHEDYYYVVTESCSQGDLLRELVLAENGRLGENRVKTRILLPILQALTFLHDHNYVHTAVHPENVFICNGERVKLGDVRHAVHACEEHDIQSIYQNRSTDLIDYCPPEWLNASVEVQQLFKIDVWQVGCLVYELLVGKPPFEADDPLLTAGLIMYGEVCYYPDISQEAKEFIQCCLIKDPSQRPDIKFLIDHTWMKQKSKIVDFFQEPGHQDVQSARSWNPALCGCYGNRTDVVDPQQSGQESGTLIQFAQWVDQGIKPEGLNVQYT